MKKLFNSKRFMSLVLTLLMIVSSIAWDGLTVEAAITYGDNLIQNGDFETVEDDLFTNWGGTYTVDKTERTLFGTNSIKSSGKNTVSQLVELKVTGEKTYVLTGYIYLEAGRIQLALDQYNGDTKTTSQTLMFGAAGTKYVTDHFSFTDLEGDPVVGDGLPVNGWYKFSREVSVAETTTHLKMTFTFNNAGNFDNLELREKIEVAADTGLVPNGAFETAGTGEGSDVFADWSETVSKEDDELIVDGYTGSAVQVGSGISVEQVLAVEAGQTYELTGYINMDGARAYVYVGSTELHFDLREDSETVTNSLTPHIIFESASGNPVDAPVQKGGWFKFSYLVTATADTMNLKLAGKSGLVLFDDISLHEATDVINVTEVALDKNELTLQEGSEATLSATFAPADAKYQTVAWTTDNSDVATVDRNGKVTAVAAGIATITATSNNGKSATCTVTVKAPFDGIMIENGGFENLTEDRKSFAEWTAGVSDNVAIYTRETDTSAYPSGVMDGDYSLFVKNCNSVASNGVNQYVDDIVPGATYVLTGYCWTLARAYFGVEGYSDEAHTNVTDASGNNLLLRSGRATANCTFYDKDGKESTTFAHEQWIKFVYTFTVSENTEYLKISLGSYSTAYAVFDNVSLQKLDIPVTSVSLDKEELALAVDGETTLVATVAPDNASDKTVIWTVSPEGVVTVDENGKVTAVTAGIATITATSNNGKSANCTVTVTDPAFTVNGAPFDGTLLEAIAAAEAGNLEIEKIELCKTVDLGTESIGTKKSFTLDLNGCTLTVGSFGEYVNVIDNSDAKTGLLKVAINACTLPPTNEQMPVYNAVEGGYAFTTIKDQNDEAINSSENAFKLIFRPSFGIGTLAKNSLLANGGDAAGIGIKIRLNWLEPADGEFNAAGYGDNGNAVHVTAYNSVEQPVAVESGETYELTGYIKMDGARARVYVDKLLEFRIPENGTCTEGLTFMQADGITAADAPERDGNWYKFSYSFTATTDSITLKLIGKSENAYFDNISICKIGDAKNLVPNGDFETTGTSEGDDVFADWTEIRGDVPKTQVLYYENGMIADVYLKTKAFYINATGTQNFDGLKITPYIESTTGVVKDLETFNVN